MTGRTQVQVVIGIAVVVFAAGILLSGDQPNPGWLRFYSAAVTAALVVLAAWDRWLWRLGPVQRISSVPPNLSGTWKGTLTSFWNDPEAGTPPPPKDAYLVIRQTASAVSVTMLTDEMKSRSSSSTISGEDGDRTLDYMYLSKPDSRLEHRSRIHHGSTSLDLTGRPVSRLRGRYWTNRDSRGELDFRDRVSATADDFESAATLFH